MNQTRRTTTARHDGAQVTTPASDLKAAGFRPTRVLRFEAVRDRTGLSRSTIWRLERRGTFPMHRRISLNAVGWLEEEVDQWIRSCASL
ncbi:MAG: AlpA family phage regulatory protein [Vicinamibacterales bacterium]